MRFLVMVTPVSVESRRQAFLYKPLRPLHQASSVRVDEDSIRNAARTRKLPHLSLALCTAKSPAVDEPPVFASVRATNRSAYVVAISRENPSPFEMGADLIPSRISTARTPSRRAQRVRSVLCRRRIVP